jgi:hypothetical protein
MERGKITSLSSLMQSLCAIVRHYAFESKYKTPEALFAYQKIRRELGINGWIQEITAWHGNPTRATES